MSKNNNSLEVVATANLLQLFIRTQSVTHSLLLAPVVVAAVVCAPRDEAEELLLLECCSCSIVISLPRCNCSEVFHTHTAPS